MSRVVQMGGVILLICLGFAQEAALAQEFSDNFADRQLLTGTSAFVNGSNSNYTVEPYEPKPAGKVGGHSAWISWVAPDNGLVTLTTSGSTFDTLLAVYTLESGDDPPLQRLQEVSSDDDYGGLVTSYLQFGANSNQTYQITVDGFNGAAGDISLQLSLLVTTNLQPTVVSRSGDQALRLGDPLILTVNLVPSPNLEYKWYLNGSPVVGSGSDSASPSLVIPSLQSTNLGFYSLKFSLNDDSFFSAPIEIQVNSEGQTKVLARNKYADSAQSGLTGGVMIGYNGTQIFNTTNAIVDTNAPSICGVPPGAAYWFSYKAPTNGIMSITTSNSSFATLLGVFTYYGTLTSYTNLIPVACDNNNGGTGTNTSSVQFATTNGGNYFIVVGGVNGAAGVAQINYALSPGFPPTQPLVTTQPQSLEVSAQTAVALSVVASGTPPLSYQWWKNASAMRQQTNASLLLRSPQSQDSASYTVVVTNIAGAVTSAPASIKVISSAQLNLDTSANLLVSAWPAIRGLQYSVDHCASTSLGSWVFQTNAFPDSGGVLWLTNSTMDYPSLLLRIHTP